MSKGLTLRLYPVSVSVILNFNGTWNEMCFWTCASRTYFSIEYKRERDVWFVQRCESALQILAVDIEQHHAPAVDEKSLGGRQSDPTRRSGHQCDLLCCFAHRPPSPFVVSWPGMFRPLLAFIAV